MIFTVTAWGHAWSPVETFDMFTLRYTKTGLRLLFH